MAPKKIFALGMISGAHIGLTPTLTPTLTLTLDITTSA